MVPDSPHFSVVIPALNEEEVLPACLESMRGQDFDGTFEVIVVDNGSTDDTAAVAHRYDAVVVSEPTRGVCHARQAGTDVARGAIVVSTDADTVVPSDWLSRIADVFSRCPEVVATAGPCRFTDAPWWALPYTQALFGWVAVWFRLTGRVCYASATNLAFRRSAFPGYERWLTQGGDELAVLRGLRAAGKIHFDRRRTSHTSSRRLHRGLFYSLFFTCLYSYVITYNVNRLVGRPLMGTAPPIREVAGGTRARGIPVTWSWVSTAAAVALIMVTLAVVILSPMDVDIA
jgi:glycosyltransferase involved in cell wall biosynthesis